MQTQKRLQELLRRGAFEMSDQSPRMLPRLYTPQRLDVETGAKSQPLPKPKARRRAAAGSGRGKPAAAAPAGGSYMAARAACARCDGTHRCNGTHMPCCTAACHAADIAIMEYCIVVVQQQLPRPQQAVGTTAARRSPQRREQRLRSLQLQFHPLLCVCQCQFPCQRAVPGSAGSQRRRGGRCST